MSDGSEPIQLAPSVSSAPPSRSWAEYLGLHKAADAVSSATKSAASAVGMGSLAESPKGDTMLGGGRRRHRKTGRKARKTKKHTRKH